MRIPRLFRMDPPLDLSSALSGFWLTNLGQRVLQEERMLIRQVLPRCFGLHAAQVGSTVDIDWLEDAIIPHRFVVDKHIGVKGLQLCSDPEHLALTAESLDLLMFHHGLDVCSRPQAWLREATRVLRPGGHVMIVGFNPWSTWGLFRWLLFPWHRQPWLQRPLSPSRLADWLTLLDFAIIGLEATYAYPPLKRAGSDFYWKGWAWLLRRFCPQAGAVYVLLARKQSVAMTPLKLLPKVRSVMTPVWLADSRPASRDATDS